MKEQLEHRLNDLKAEFDAGQKMLAELEARQTRLRETLLRISGAIQVLEEVLAIPSQSKSNDSQEPIIMDQETSSRAATMDFS